MPFARCLTGFSTFLVTLAGIFCLIPSLALSESLDRHGTSLSAQTEDDAGGYSIRLVAWTLNKPASSSHIVSMTLFTRQDAKESWTVAAKTQDLQFNEQQVAVHTVNFSNQHAGTHNYKSEIVIHESAGKHLVGTDYVDVVVSASVPTPIPEGPTPIETGKVWVHWHELAVATRYVLEERKDERSWITVQDGSEREFRKRYQTSGVYEYRLKACNPAACGSWSSPYKVSITLLPLPSAADPVYEQFGYKYQARRGDFDGDGTIDILIDRLTPGAVDGSMQTVIIRGPQGGVPALVANLAAIAHARSFPISTEVIVGSFDHNFDGYADLIVSGLQAVDSGGFNEDNLILYASGESGSPLPQGYQLVGEEYSEFFGDFLGAFVDPNYFVNRQQVTDRSVYRFVFGCKDHVPKPNIVNAYCNFKISQIGTVKQPRGIGHHPLAPVASAALRAVIDRDYSSGNPWLDLSKAMKPIIGVNSFGFRDDDTWGHTNYRRSQNTTSADELGHIMSAYMYGLIIPMSIDP